ncbi:MAG: AmmeMemoRadiSam system radical SAM enzyme [Deltaproteobacteria bacterium]|nr:AmmeMemoRadiSam system radical SAM enzyme [Deltaproteobacteria bacterium]
MFDRREILAGMIRLATLLGGAGLILTDPFLWEILGKFEGGCVSAQDRLEAFIRQAPRARYWTSTALAGNDCLQCHSATETLGGRYVHQSGLVKCLLCPQGCMLQPGERGRCSARMNVDGEMRSLVYGRPVAIHIDPIEKKPLYHYLPGSSAFSLATAGCPLRCKFCQNWEISQSRPEDHDSPYVEPEKIVQTSRQRRAPVIAFTYNEPTVFMEYLTDIARSARKEGLRSVLISCGFMNEAPLAEMCGVLEAIKIDLKGYSESFYRNVCGAELRPVLRSIRQVSRSGVHLEIVNLVVPTLNDSDGMLRGLADWILGEIGPDVPVHFTRFHPDYRLLNLPPTPVATLERAREIAMEKGIHYAYVGNVPGHRGNHTYCPNCKKMIIERHGFFITNLKLKDGRCSYCGRKIAGVWT